MRRRVLIVPDKFKGTLSASEAAAAIARGWREASPNDFLTLLPMSDGGDGFGEVLANLLPVGERTCQTVDAAHRPIEASWWWDGETGLALIESARVIGLSMLPPESRQPLKLDTFGLGTLIFAVQAVGAKRCVVGIGGSATNDGGFGLARAIGWHFVDRSDNAISEWTLLNRLDHIEPPPTALRISEIVVAVDVRNLFLGPAGASRVYGPQKGLRPEEIPAAEDCLGRLAEVAERDLGCRAAAEPGSGAAGGLGFGLRCFLRATLESGFKLFADHAQLEAHIERSDLVITAEGAIDASTLMGKGVGEIARLCRKHGVPCVGLAGSLDWGETNAASKESDFTAVYGIAPDLATVEEAKAHPAAWLSRLTSKIAASWGE